MPPTASTSDEKPGRLVEAWYNQPRAAIDPIVYVYAIQVKARSDGKRGNRSLDAMLNVKLDGQSGVLAQWVGEEAAGKGLSLE